MVDSKEKNLSKIGLIPKSFSKNFFGSPTTEIKGGVKVSCKKSPEKFEV